MEPNEPSARLLMQARDLGNKIGYQFTDVSLLDAALTRVAYAGEHGIAADKTMDRYAVIGDAVLDVAVISHLLESGEYDKGIITQKKISLVNMSVFRRIAEQIGLPEYVHWGKGELQTRIWESGRVSAECFEAVAGAAYLDGGMAAVSAIAAASGLF